MDMHVPILCATDTANSFTLSELTKRGFTLWRWDASSLSFDLLHGTTSLSEKRIIACLNQKIEYALASDNRVNDVWSFISKHRRESEEQSSGFLKMFGKLTGLAFDVLHQVIPFCNAEIEIAQNSLSNCEALLKEEKGYITEELFKDMALVIEHLREIFGASNFTKKIEFLENWFRITKRQKICIIVANGVNKRLVDEYWQNISKYYGSRNEITVYYPSEYLKHPFPLHGLTVVTGWLGSTAMRKILHSYKTEQYLVIMYGCEQRWQKSLTAAWNREKNQKDNDRIIKQYLSSAEKTVNLPDIHELCADLSEAEDELTEIEKTIQANRIRQYTGTGSSGTIRDELVQASMGQRRSWISPRIR